MSSEENKVMDENAVDENTVQEEAGMNESAENRAETPEQEESRAETPEQEESRAETPEQKENRYDVEFSREQWILTHIGDENLLEYLKMEHRREEERQNAKDMRQKRILSAFQLTISLAAVIAVIFLLRDNPTVMVNILYIIAIIAALWIWKHPGQK